MSLEAPLPSGKRRGKRLEWHKALSAPNNQELVRELIRNGADINEPLFVDEFHIDDERGNIPRLNFSKLEYQSGPPLFVALLRNHLELAETLIEAGADVNAMCYHYLMSPWVEMNDKPYSRSTLLQIAIEEDKEGFVETLLEARADVNATDHLELTALHVSLAKGNAEIAEKLIAAGAVVNARNNKGFTALHIATRYFCPFIEPLIRHGASVNAKAQNGDTPLHLALRKKEIEMAETLTNAGADVNATNNKGSTPLHEVMWNGCPFIDQLIEKGASINGTDQLGNTPLHVALQRKEIEMAEKLINARADVKARSKNGSTPLHAASWNGSLFIEPLIKNGASINATDQEGDTPLHVALQRKEIEMAERLINAGADVNATNKDGISPLHNASWYGCPFIEPLIKNGANINAIDGNGNTPLHLALHKKEIEMAETLINEGADVNSKTNDGFTPLHTASWNGCSFIEPLIKNGASIDATDQDGDTPLHVALQNGKIEMAERLINAGADVNSKTNNGFTPLHTASWSGCSFIEPLIRHGASIDATDQYGNTPLHIALQRKEIEMAEKLINAGADINAVTQTKETPLHHATKITDLKISELLPVIEKLVRGGADIKAVNAAGCTPLSNHEYLSEEVITFILSWKMQQAVSEGDRVLLDWLLIEGHKLPDIQKNWWVENDYLQIASIYGHEDILRRLLEEIEVDVNSINLSKETALHWACQSGHLNCVKALLEHGASPKIRNAIGNTPLDLARTQGHQHVVEHIELWQSQRGFGGFISKLLPRSKEKYQQMKVDERALELAEKEKECSVLQKELDAAALRIKELLSQNETANDTNNLKAIKNNMETILESHINLRSLHSQIENLKTTLQQVAGEKASRNNQPLSTEQQETRSVVSRVTTSFKSFTPSFKQKASVFEAITAGNDELVDRLLSKNPDLNMRDHEKQTLLFLACKYNRHNIIRLLVDRGADVNACNKEKATPLYIAAENGYFFVVDFLLKHKADVNASTNYDATPLLIAAENGHIMVVEALLKAGARLNVAKKGGFTPLYVAARNDRREVVQMLLERGADPNASSDKKMTPLHRAAVEGHRQVVDLILEYGADTDALNAQGETPDTLAEQNGHVQVRDTIASWRNTPQKERQRLIKENQRQRKEKMQRLMQASTEGTSSYLPILYSQLARETLDIEELRDKLDGLKLKDKQGLDAMEIESEIEEVNRELASKKLRVDELRQQIDEYEGQRMDSQENNITVNIATYGNVTGAVLNFRGNVEINKYKDNSTINEEATTDTVV